MPARYRFSVNKSFPSANGDRNGRQTEIIIGRIMRKILNRCAVVLAIWLPFFAIGVGFGMSYGHDSFLVVVAGTLASAGSAGLLGIGVWFLYKRFPWPLGFNLKFYLLQIFFAVIYGAIWTAAVYGLETLRHAGLPPAMRPRSVVVRELLLGVWYYAIFAGISYAVQTRNRLHDKEVLAAHAETLATAARLDAIRARLNPHFLFNALHTLAALVKFRPNLAEGAIERLGDMLRYTLKEDGRELVEFSEEYEFTREYLAFEQLRYEDRLKVTLQIHPESLNLDIPPFSLQTLAENAVRHAISVRPDGGAIWIKSWFENGRFMLSVRDDGPGGICEAGQSHQFGLRFLRERLWAAYGSSADLQLQSGPDGFEALLVIPSSGGKPAVEPEPVGEHK